MLCAAFMVSPEFNFSLTSPVRQCVVNHFVETTQPIQEGVQINTVLLGKTTGYIYTNNLSVYFRFYRGSIFSDRAFILYTTDPIEKTKREQRASDDQMIYRQLKENWFFILTEPSPD